MLLVILFSSSLPSSSHLLLMRGGTVLESDELSLNIGGATPNRTALMSVLRQVILKSESEIH
jgi:hypothetical protein